MIICDQSYISFLNKRILQQLHLKIFNYPIICSNYKCWKRKGYIACLYILEQIYCFKYFIPRIDLNKSLKLLMTNQYFAFHLKRKILGILMTNQYFGEFP